MADVYSVSFGRKHDAVIGDELLYVVPAGFVAVLRDIDAYFGLLTGTQIFLQANDLPDNVNLWQDSWAIAETGWRSWRGRQVFNAGDQFTIFGNDVVDCGASGYLLAAP